MSRIRRAGRLREDPRTASLIADTLLGQNPDIKYFTFDDYLFFGRRAPLEVELGSGKGNFIITTAREFPERNFLAVELGGSAALMLAVRVARSGVKNVRVLRADARSLVSFLILDHSVSAYHIYYPDPWPKARHAKHRLFSAAFVEGLRRTLKPEGRVYVATDVPWWAAEIFASLEKGGFKRLDIPVPGAMLSEFGRRFRAAGRPTFAGGFAL